MTKAYILERNTTITILETRITNHTDNDFIIIEDGLAHLELQILPTDDVQKINDRWIKTFEETK
jgi:hypothetical protein